jgi:Protein of unknown function (DUF3800)
MRRPLALQQKPASEARRLSETISSVPYWGMLVHPKDGHPKVFCVLHAYLDDSGTHDSSPVCVVAGYFGSERHWTTFDAKWRAILDSFGIEEFHANKFWACVEGANVTEFRGWDDAKCGSLIRSLLNLISESKRIYPVGCLVDMNEWKSLTRDERAFLTGARYDSASGSLKSPGAANKTYFLPFLTTIADALDHCNWGQLMHFTFDASKSFSAYALDYFQQIKATQMDNFRKMGEIFFADSKKATPVQAADLLAYEIYRYGIRKLEAGNARISPSTAMVYAMENARDRKSIPMYEKFSMGKALERFRSDQRKGSAK